MLLKTTAIYISHPLKYLQFKRLTTPNIGNNVEQLELTDSNDVKYGETTLEMFGSFLLN